MSNETTNTGAGFPSIFTVVFQSVGFGLLIGTILGCVIGSLLKGHLMMGDQQYWQRALIWGFSMFFAFLNGIRAVYGAAREKGLSSENRGAEIGFGVIMFEWAWMVVFIGWPTTVKITLVLAVAGIVGRGVGYYFKYYRRQTTPTV